MVKVKAKTGKDYDRERLERSYALKANPRKLTPKSAKAIAPDREAPTLSADYESDILKMLRWQMAQEQAIALTPKPMFDHFAPMVKIQSSGTVLPFKPYDFQSHLIVTIDANTQTVVVKSRQMGISETICCYLLMRAVTEPGFAAIVFSKTQDDSAKLGKRIRDMALSLGSLCPELATESAKKLAFKKLGGIDFLPVTARSARGIPSVSVLFFDEAAFIDGIDGVYQAAVPTLSMLGGKGKVIFNSTPNGRSGLFYRLMISGPDDKKNAIIACREIGEPSNNIKPFDRLSKHTRSWVTKGWAKVFLHWRVHPVYGEDPDWAEKTREDRQLTRSQWDQEYELAFSEGSTAVFPQELVDACAIGVWAEPIAGRKYIMGIDPAFGGSDAFVAQVWQLLRGRYSLVSEYTASRTSKTINIQRTIELIDKYKPFNVNIETNSGGGIILEDLSKQRSWVQWGEVNTGNKSKIENTDRLVLMMERLAIDYPLDSELAQQMSHFVEKIGSKMKATTRTREAESGFHDDSVMAAAVAFADMDQWIGQVTKKTAIEGILG